MCGDGDDGDDDDGKHGVSLGGKMGLYVILFHGAVSIAR